MIDRSPPAFAIVTDADWVRAIRFANQLLRSGVRVLQTTEALSGASLPRGTLIVPCDPAFDPGVQTAPTAAAVTAAAGRAGVELVPVGDGERVIAAPLSAVTVGLFGGGGAPFNHAAILAECGFPLRFISDAEIRAGGLSAIDVLVVPGGGFRGMHGQLEPLGEMGCRAIADFVRRGGTYIGCCAGSYDCAVTPEGFLQSCPTQRHLQVINARIWWVDDAVEFNDFQTPGVGVVTVRNERPDHPVMFGLPPTFEIVHYNGPIFEPLVERVVEGAADAVGLAAFAGWTRRFTPAEEFAGQLANPQSTVLSRAVEAGRFSIVAGECGLGRVVAFGSHPEFGFDLPMVEWSQPARMLANAVLWQAMAGPVAVGNGGSPVSNGRIALPIGAALAEVQCATRDVVERAQSLQLRAIEPRPGWLTPDYSLSFFGIGPDEIWRRSLDAMQTLAQDAADLAAQLNDRVTTLVSARRSEALDARLQAAVTRVERWVLDERSPEWHQDGGYQGVLRLLRTAVTMCDEAVESWEVELGPPAGPYAYLHTNPYHLVAGSYLAAVGCVAGAVQLLRALSAELDMAQRLTFPPGLGG